MNKKTAGKIVTILVGAAIVLAALYIMSHGLGLNKEMDFGAGAYYYADIPEYEKIDPDGAYTPKLPYIVYVLLFLAWGALMWALWKWIDRRK